MKFDINSSSLKGYILAIISGSCASITSIFVKISLTDQLWTGYHFLGWWLIVTLKCSLFLLAIFFNSIMWTLFVQSSQYLPTSLTMVYSMATNVFLTSVIGFIFLNESIKFLWFVGATCIMLGVFIIISNDKNEVKNE